MCGNTINKISVDNYKILFVLETFLNIWICKRTKIIYLFIYLTEKLIVKEKRRLYTYEMQSSIKGKITQRCGDR